jgi:hypothetical protein
VDESGRDACRTAARGGSGSGSGGEAGFSLERGGGTEAQGSNDRRTTREDLMASNQLQNQLTRFISRGRNRRKPPSAMTERPLRPAKLPSYRPVKRSRKTY